MNTIITGRIYHVVDKTTGEVIKVGSTVRALKVRWWNYDKKKYPNHFLKQAREIESSEQDVYDADDLHCPFLWHLVAAEQMEMFKMGTFRKSRLSNIHLPLFQKFNCFDRKESILAGASLGGRISGISSRDNKTGIHSPGFDKSAAARKGGLSNVESGHLQRVASAGGKVSGLIQGRSHVENKTGICGRSLEKMQIDELNNRTARVAGARSFLHIRWHVRRGVASPNCIHCKDNLSGNNNSKHN